jgi:excisionase family DNA binding protein
MDALMTTDELSEFLRIPRATIYRWRQDQTGPRCVRVGKHLRFRRSDVEAWLDGLEQDDRRAPVAAL